MNLYRSPLPIDHDMADPANEDPAARLRISSAADTLAVIPYLLGFHPRESVVAMVLQGNQVKLTARLPLEILERPDELNCRLAQMAGMYPNAAWLLAGYCEDRERAIASVEEVLGHLEDAQVCEVLDALVVSQGRFWSLLCDDESCCPPEGQILDAVNSPIAVQAIIHGLQALPDRDDLVERVRPPRGWAARAATERMNDAFVLIRQLGFSRAEEFFDELLDRGLADPLTLTEDELAALAAMVFFASLRDIGLRRIHRFDAERHVELWQTVVRATPREFQPAVLGVLGLASWVSGDGAMQVVCLERGAKIAPGHSLMALLEEINRMAAPPSLWEQVLADLSGPAVALP